MQLHRQISIVIVQFTHENDGGLCPSAWKQQEDAFSAAWINHESLDEDSWQTRHCYIYVLVGRSATPLFSWCQLL